MFLGTLWLKQGHLGGVGTLMKSTVLIEESEGPNTPGGQPLAHWVTSHRTPCREHHPNTLSVSATQHLQRGAWSLLPHGHLIEFTSPTGQTLLFAGGGHQGSGRQRCLISGLRVSEQQDQGAMAGLLVPKLLLSFLPRHVEGGVSMATQDSDLCQTDLTDPINSTD